MLFVVIALLVLAALAWFWSQGVARSTGLPEGKIDYDDSGGWGRLEKPLFSRRLNLVGKPDYVVRRGGQVVPVEVKGTRAPTGRPYDSHIYQLAAYCVLLEEAYGARPSHGLIKYSDKVVEVAFTTQLEAGLVAIVDAIRADETAEDVARSHQAAARCRGCGFRDVCDQALPSQR